jgi:hypothetical protein
VRKITLTDRQGRRLLEVPLALGLTGVFLLPMYAAVGLIAALVTECTIRVERAEPMSS